MIIHIAGTSGAGKSWVVRQVMAQAEHSAPLMRAGRSSHVGYLLTLPEVTRGVYVLGSYEAPTGGCDTIKDAEQNYTTVREQHAASHHVLYEGLFVMNHTRGLQLARDVGAALTTIQLTTPLEECFERIAARRAEQGKTEPVARKNTEGNWVRCLNYCSKMRQAGHRVIKSGSQEAPEVIMGLLRGAV